MPEFHAASALLPQGWARDVLIQADATGAIAAEGTETRIWAKKDGDARSLKAIAIPADVKRRLEE